MSSLLKRTLDELENLGAKCDRGEPQGWEGTRRRSLLADELRAAVEAEENPEPKLRLGQLMAQALTQAASSKYGWDVFRRLSKLGEEVGELNEAVLIYTGNCPHKELKEPVPGEVADVLIQDLDVLWKAYQPLHLSNDELLTVLAEHLERKLAKWDAVVAARSNTKPRDGAVNTTT